MHIPEVKNILNPVYIFLMDIEGKILFAFSLHFFIYLNTGYEPSGFKAFKISQVIDNNKCRKLGRSLLCFFNNVTSSTSHKQILGRF